MVSQTLWTVYFPCRRGKTKEKNHETDKPELKIEHPVANFSVSKKQRSQTRIQYKNLFSSGDNSSKIILQVLGQHMEWL